MKPEFNQKLKRNELLDFMRQQVSTMVVMEVCYSSHYWGREMAKLGHDVKLIPAQHVTPFVRGNKNDRDSLAWFLKCDNAISLTRIGPAELPDRCEFSVT